VGVVLAAVYLLWAYQRVFQGAPDDDNKGFAEMTWGEGLLMAPLLALIVFLGLYPKPVLERMEPSVDRLIAHVEEYRDGPSGDTDVAAEEDQEVADVDEVDEVGP
jgi:NADH-quinone oxidoreductase subunit M